VTRLLPGDRLRLAELGPDNQPQCEWCGGPIAAQRSNARFCSDAHRAAAHRARIASEASTYSQFRSRVQAGATSVDNYSDVWWKYVLSQQGADPSEIVTQAEHRALSEGSNPAGGFLVPTDFSDQVLEAAVAESAIAQLATQIDTDSGENFPAPIISAYGTAQWLAEAAAISATDETFAQSALGAFKSGAKTIASEELVDDSAVNFDALMARALGWRLGAIQRDAFAQGFGSGQPLGIATSGNGIPTSTGATGSTLMFRTDVQAHYLAAPAAYRARAVWVLHPDLFGRMAGAVDTAGGYLFPSLQAAQPTLMARPVYIDAGLPPAAANARSGVFGDIETAFGVRRVRGLGLQKLVELHSDQGQIGYKLTERVDSRVLVPGAAVVLINSAT
jgi:HK97 family phage major capsid protein